MDRFGLAGLPRSRDSNAASYGRGPDLCPALCPIHAVGVAGEDDLDAPDLIGRGPSSPDRDRRPPSRGNGRLNRTPSSPATRTPVARPEPRVDKSNTTKAKGLDAVPLEVALSASLRDVMIAELNDIDSEDAAAKWAHRRLKEKNKLNAADAKHIGVSRQAVEPCHSRRPSARPRHDGRTSKEGKVHRAIASGRQSRVDPSRTPACSRP